MSKTHKQDTRNVSMTTISCHRISPRLIRLFCVHLQQRQQMVYVPTSPNKRCEPLKVTELQLFRFIPLFPSFLKNYFPASQLIIPHIHFHRMSASTNLKLCASLSCSGGPSCAVFRKQQQRMAWLPSVRRRGDCTESTEYTKLTSCLLTWKVLFQFITRVLL